MKTLWILAAAATFAACHNRSEDETGAAPDKGDTTMVKTDTSSMKPSTGYDTTTVKTDTTSTTQPTPAPSTGVDTTSAQPAPAPSTGGYDTTSTTQPTTPPSTGGYDTTSTTQPTSPSTGVDTTMAPNAGGTTSDSASTQR